MAVMLRGSERIIVSDTATIAELESIGFTRQAVVSSPGDTRLPGRSLGSPRPTATAIPVWNNRVGWYWTDPATGIPIGGNRDNQPALIGRTLPAGWVDNGGGSADFIGVSRLLGEPIRPFPDTIPEVIPVVMPDDFYGFEPVSLLGPPLPGSSNGTGALPVAGAIVPISQLVARLPVSLAGRVTAWAVGLGGGARMAWASLPSWLRSAMSLIGLSGATILVDVATEGPIQIGGGGGNIPRVGQPWNGATVLNTWTANGIPFWKTEGVNGGRPRHWVQKMDGSIHSWVPQRPVVLMPGGAKNVRDLLRADDIVDRQLKKVDKALRRRRPTPRKPREKTPPSIVIDHHH